MTLRRFTTAGVALGLALLLTLVLAGCQGGPPGGSAVLPAPGQIDPTEDDPTEDEPTGDEPGPTGRVTLGFAGDVHFELHLADLPQRGAQAFGAMREVLRRPDLTMLNLETTLTERGRPEPKEYTFRTGPEALPLLRDLGVDVVTMANNHAGDYGRVGLQDTFAALKDSPVPVIGVGRDADEAFAPYRTSIGGTDLAFFAVNAIPGYTSSTWAAGADEPGVAVALEPRPRLLREVRRAAGAGEVVVVYLHWGREIDSCPTARQRRHVRALAEAGAEVVVGTHAHVLQGAGWAGGTFVGYGLGDFVWYHNYRPETGVLMVTLEDGEAVDHALVPALIQPSGLPRVLRGEAREQARGDWRALNRCTGLAATPQD